jgi:alpha-D-ribose 1-methylphosphonate 5-triphosphate synthase subunit PhnH
MTVPTLPVHLAREQRVFRAWLGAMARPGTVAMADLHPQGGRLGAAVALLEAVLDHEVTFAVVPEQAGVIETLLRLTGARVDCPEEASYLLCEGEGIAEALKAAKEGTPEYPDRSGTVIAAVQSVSADSGAGQPLTLRGPGIEHTQTVWVAGFTEACRRIFGDRNQDLPMGIDLVLVAPDGRFTCLPRYTRVEG